MVRLSDESWGRGLRVSDEREPKPRTPDRPDRYKVERVCPHCRHAWVYHENVIEILCRGCAEWWRVAAKSD